MIRVFITALFLIFCLGVYIPVQAQEKTVTKLGNAAIVSGGLYFKICDISSTKNNIDITVQAKNKSMLSQAVYIELIDANGKIYSADDKDSINFFKPLKFNKPITQKISFTVADTNKKYWLAVYNKDIFKKNKKQIITKIPLNEVKKELNIK